MQTGDPIFWKADETPVHLSSPLKNTLVVTLREENNTPVSYQIPPFEIITHPKWKADVLCKHIVDAMINERALGYVTPEERAKLVQEVEVTLE